MQYDFECEKCGHMMKAAIRPRLCYKCGAGRRHIHRVGQPPAARQGEIR
jgi:ABC-type ATPase with predicted acetyltransferase domain